ncbi:LOW QUALITY PROTEIN: hypothetical protein DAPPUDRAFT_237697 [Daphnia pulex]|uniref:Uncharacterized protein n=1 Tax=Daphnia pulex TaxID=6669 RepID=E9G5M5_DAPPU|nr:LOW QUALITY PROTEIN: hypothetical protein DAPPUDRAFT_237697 [Daphnia pulex]|eukprot:EFX85229.1 LOW QUALITY PROTEIN: hypothetical protein DAPPUDRAFT_237697 [Daphnia pulex]
MLSIFVLVLLLGVLSLLAGRPLVYRTPPRLVTMASFYRWLSFIAESTTVAPMSHGYGGYQTATSLPNYTTYATTGYYTEAHNYYTDAPAYFTIEAHKYCTTKASEYYTTSHAAPASTPTLQNTTPPENRSTTRLRMLPQLTTPAFYTSLLHRGSQLCSSLLHRGPEYYSVPSYIPTTETAEYYAVPTYYTVAATSYYVDPNYYSEVPVYYTKIYAAPSYYTGAPVYCNTKESEYYTTTYAFPTYHTEAAKYSTAPSYHTIKAAEYLSVIP